MVHLTPSTTRDQRPAQQMPRLSDREGQEVMRDLEADQPLPEKNRFLLFAVKRTLCLWIKPAAATTAPASLPSCCRVSGTSRAFTLITRISPV